MKKLIISISSLFLILLILGGTIFFLPNELHFKVSNLNGDFKEAERVFPAWSILSQNNELTEKYHNKKYQEILSKINEIIKNDCNINNEKISEFCTNIFYVQGLSYYQVGKDLEQEKQKEFFENSIFAFTKVMAMTEENSKEYLWAKENIEFIQNKFKQQQQQTQDKKNDNSNKNKKDSKDKSNSNEQKKSNDNSSNKENNKEKNKSKDKGNDKKNKSNNTSNSEKQESRLPKEMQKALDNIQKQLDEEQKESQKGFNRSKAAAEKNKINDPFSDPFFQNIFGNDPFFSNPFDKKFNKQIQNENEKDW